MSYQTRAPGGGWSTVNPLTTYSGVASSYRASIAAAVLAEKNTELESKVFDYKEGLLSFKELNDYLSETLSGEDSGSQRELELRKIMSAVQEFENDKNRSIDRSKAEAKFIKNGISASERRQIEEGLLASYKEGTPEYVEQLNIIAAAKELERVEENNARVARLEASLSEGGLTTSEELEVTKEMRDLTEPGSVERGQLDTKVALFENEVLREQKEAAKTERIIELIDETKAGGQTNEELLAINRDLQTFEEPGSSGMLALKQSEAELLGDIATASSGTSAGAKNFAAAQLAQIEAESERIENQFKTGLITDRERAQAKSELLGEKESLIEGLGDAVLSDRTLAKTAGALPSLRAELDTETEQRAAGNTITVINPRTGEREEVPNSFEFLQQFAEDTQLAQMQERTDKQIKSGETLPLALEKDKVPVITVESEGQRFQAELRPDGTLEILVPREDEFGSALVRSGSDLAEGSFSQAKQRDVFSGLEDGPKMTIAPTVGDFKAPQMTKLPDADKIRSSVAQSTAGVKDQKFNFGGFLKKLQAFTPFAPLKGKGFGTVASPGKISGTRDFGVSETINRFAPGFQTGVDFISNLFSKKEK